MPVRYSRKPPPALPLPHPPVKKPPTADKETQTDPAEFKHLNGQTVQPKNEEKKQEDTTKEDNKQCNNVKPTNDKSNTTPVTNEKADTL
ncbi:hypothetical protein HF086_013507 [Spodoptera exigua]|uniref:Uncharacterized protein n=1 Tax=Spodoptera exigua TaxID=7107 RepID=A0A922M6R8_SPOEX|nr:hypothetical protein HF086_013507 [Spodoptera exigua]